MKKYLLFVPSEPRIFRNKASLNRNHFVGQNKIICSSERKKVSHTDTKRPESNESIRRVHGVKKSFV